MLSVKSDSIFCMIASETKEVSHMNKLVNWIRNHKEETEDGACLAAFAVGVFLFFFGKEIAIALCAVAGVLALGAGITE